MTASPSGSDNGDTTLGPRAFPGTERAQRLRGVVERFSRRVKATSSHRLACPGFPGSRQISRPQQSQVTQLNAAVPNLPFNRLRLRLLGMLRRNFELVVRIVANRFSVSGRRLSMRRSLVSPAGIGLLEATVTPPVWH